MVLFIYICLIEPKARIVLKMRIKITWEKTPKRQASSVHLIQPYVCSLRKENALSKTHTNARQMLLLFSGARSLLTHHMTNVAVLGLALPQNGVGYVHTSCVHIFSPASEGSSSGTCRWARTHCIWSSDAVLLTLCSDADGWVLSLVNRNVLLSFLWIQI